MMLEKAPEKQSNALTDQKTHKGVILFEMQYEAKFRCQGIRFPPKTLKVT